MQVRARFVLLLMASLVPCAAFAQKYELAVTAGGYFPTGIQTDVHVAGAVEGSFAARFFSVPFASAYVEVPVARTFDAGLNVIQGNYSATFVTPGVKLKLAPSFFASPYFVAGVGVAHFSASGTLTGSSLNRSATSAAVDFGGGLDVKIAPYVSLRGEVRDVNSGGLGFAVPLVSGRQNNLLVTGGLVLRL